MPIKIKNAFVLGLAVTVPSFVSAEESKLDQYQSTLASALKTADANPDNRSGALAEFAKNEAVSYVGSEVKNTISRWLPQAEISIEGIENNKPTFGLLTVQPIYQSNDLTHTGFVQGSVFYSDSRTTGNIGLGYRRMSDDQKWLYGANVFYDHEWPYDHNRWSVGMDIRSSAFEFNANRYMAISSEVSGRDGGEQALDGYDLEIGAQVPYVPSAKLYAKRFLWEGVNGVSDLKGYQYSIDVNAPIMQGLTLDMGIRDYSGSKANDKYVRLAYKFDFGAEKKKPQPVPSFISKKAFELTSMKDRRLDKVRRENKIVKQFVFNATISGF